MPFITQVLLPERDNLGRAFGRARYGAFHARLIRRFGGWTRQGQAEGAWLSPSGTIFTDEHWVYEVGHERRDLLSASRKRTTQDGIRPRRDLDHAIRRTAYLTLSSHKETYSWELTHCLPCFTDQGRRVHLRFKAGSTNAVRKSCERYSACRPARPVWGSPLQRNRFRFEFVADNQSIELTAEQLHAPSRQTSGEQDLNLYCLRKQRSQSEPTPFVVPPSPQGKPWRRIVDTGMTPPYDIVEFEDGPRVPEGKAYVLAPYAMLVLISEPEA